MNIPEKDREHKFVYQLLQAKFGYFKREYCELIKINTGRFRKKWHAANLWLDYSSKKQSAFYFYCRAFPYKTLRQLLHQKSFIAWHNATTIFLSHFNSGDKEATAKVIVLRFCFGTGSIATTISSYHKIVVIQNKYFSKYVIDTFLFYAQ